MTMGITSPTSTTGQILKDGTAVISFDANNNATFAGTVVSNTPLGMRNRIINGDMRIDQRNAGASVTPSAIYEQYTLDRWDYIFDTASKISIQQNAGSVTPPTGFTNYLGATTVSAYSVASGNFLVIAQKIEGYNISDLAWGTANAKTITLSFWVRSSLTGTFGGSLRNSDATRSYPFSYTISSANTWEQKTITITGDTSGTYLTTNGIGMQVNFGLGVGSTYSGTAGSWASANYLSATGATSVVGTNGATFYITGVQLEIGTSATPFERRLYGQELALCQRYYYRIKATTFGVGQCFSTTGALGSIPFPVTMRTSPTALEQSGTASDYRVFAANTAGLNCNAVPVYNATTGFQFGYYELSVASGLVAGNITNVTSNTASAYLGWSAEL